MPPHTQSSSAANGSAEWPPDDRLRRTIQYPRDVSDRTEKPRRTGYPACAGYDGFVWGDTNDLNAMTTRETSANVRIQQRTPEETSMLTLHHLNDSRSQRILGLREELGPPYEMKGYARDATTRLAPPELTAVHPLGKSPVITDGDIRIAESAAIVDYIIRRYGKGAMMPPPGRADCEDYNTPLHYSEGCARLPLRLRRSVAK